MALLAGWLGKLVFSSSEESFLITIQISSTDVLVFYLSCCFRIPSDLHIRPILILTIILLSITCPEELTIMAEANPSNGYFSMGLDTLKVPVQLFAENRKKICEKLKSLPSLPQGSIILLQGGGDQGRCEGEEKRRCKQGFANNKAECSRGIFIVS